MCHFRWAAASLSGIFLLLTTVPIMPALQESNASGVPPAIAKPRNHRYTIVIPEATKTWNTGQGKVTSASISQTIANTLVRRLAQRRFIRVRQLDVQCCVLQLELLNVIPAGKIQQRPFTITARIILLDVDRENLYSKEFQGEASGNSRNAVAGAASALATNALNDTALLKVLAGS